MIGLSNEIHILFTIAFWDRWIDYLKRNAIIHLVYNLVLITLALPLSASHSISFDHHLSPASLLQLYLVEEHWLAKNIGG